MRYASMVSIIATLLLVGGCTPVLTPTFGLRQGELAPCPGRRDCVSTQDKQPRLHIRPLTYTSTQALARSDLLIAISVVGESRIVSNHRNYLRVEYPIAIRSRQSAEYYYQPANAVDDVEFYLVPGKHVIEMRSIAKLGLLDLGANRARLERIRATFETLQQQHD